MNIDEILCKNRKGVLDKIDEVVCWFDSLIFWKKIMLWNRCVLLIREIEM